MIKIGLLSDTHGFWDDKYLQYFSECDQIWHAGDVGSIDIITQLENFKPFRGVYGNIDGAEVRSILPEFHRFTLDGVSIYMTHIAGYPGKYDSKIRPILQNIRPQLLICGHSHILKVMFDKQLNCLVINPGAAGKHGFHKVRTLVRFNINNASIQDLEVIELSK